MICSEEEHMKQYLETTALKEQEAKKKLAELMEELLQRAEHAEAQLQVPFGLSRLILNEQERDWFS